MGRQHKTLKRGLYFTIEFGKAHTFWERILLNFLIGLTFLSVLCTMSSTVAFDTCAFPAWTFCQDSTEHGRWTCPIDGGTNFSSAAPVKAQPKPCKWKGDPGQVYNRQFVELFASFHALVEGIAICVFALEFILRMWTCTVNKSNWWMRTNPTQWLHWPVP